MVSFAGGIFGAAIGAFPVWILCGLGVLLGATVAAFTGHQEFTNIIAWGWFIGPQTAFTGGVAAAAYAAKRKFIDSGRDISTSLLGLEKPSVLVVGGLFGAIGYVITWGLFNVPNYSEFPWTNVIALSVILNMVLTRFIFGKTGLFGKREKGQSCWKPTENAKWVKYQSEPASLVLLAIAIGLPAAHLSLAVPNSIGIVFGFVTVLLLFMLMGFNVPVTHHIALSSSMVTTLTGSIEWGMCFAVLAAYLGEVCACLFLYRADTHIDPPTTALIFTFSIFSAVECLGVFAMPLWATWCVIAVVTVGGFVALAKCKKCYCKS